MKTECSLNWLMLPADKGVSSEVSLPDLLPQGRFLTPKSPAGSQFDWMIGESERAAVHRCKSFARTLISIPFMTDAPFMIQK